MDVGASAHPRRWKGVLFMSSDNDPLRSWMEGALKRAISNVNGAHPGKPERELDDVERIVELLEAESEKIQTLDVEKMEAALTTQAAALNVIFNQFLRAASRKYYSHESMRVALRAQSQCRSTYRGLLELKTPRFSQPKRSTQNSAEQSIESAKSPE